MLPNLLDQIQELKQRLAVLERHAGLPTFPSGDIVGTTDTQTLINKTITQPYCFLYRNAALSIPNGANTMISFDGVEANDYGMYNASNPTRVTIQKAGMYLVTALLGYQGNTTGNRILYLQKNGSLLYMPLTTATNVVLNTAGLTYTVPVVLAQNDYLEMGTYQGSGGDLALWVGAAEYRAPRFRVVRI